MLNSTFVLFIEPAGLMVRQFAALPPVSHCALLLLLSRSCPSLSWFNVCVLGHSMQRYPSSQAYSFSASQKKKFSTLYGDLKFTVICTTAHQLSQSWATSIRSTPSHLCLGPASGFSLQISQPTVCMHLSSPPHVLHAPPITSFIILLPGWFCILNCVLFIVIFNTVHVD